MERSSCNECGAVIGGANHRLEEGNELAPEMDGARHAAWSEQANLENYVIVDKTSIKTVLRRLSFYFASKVAMMPTTFFLLKICSSQ